MVTQKRCKVSLIQKTDETQTHGTMIFMLLLFLSSVIHVVLKFLKQTKLKIASALGTKNNMLYLLWRVFKRVWVFLHLLLSGPFYSFSFIEFFSDFIVLFSIFHLWFSVFSRLRLFICLLIRVFFVLSQANALHHRSVCVWLEMRKATETQLTLLVAIFNDVFLVFAFGIRIYVSTDEPIWAVPKRMKNTQWTHRLLDINWKLRVQHFTESAIGVDAVAAAAVVCYAAQYSVPYGDVISFQWLFRFRFVQRKLSFSLSLIPRRCTGLFLSIVTSCMPISTVYHRYFILTFCLVAFSHRSVSLNFSSFTWFMT